MSPGGTVLLRDVFDLLDSCAPGYSVQEKDHRIRVHYRQKKVYRLPTGAHGKRERRAEIEVGYVVDMVLLFGIRDCAERTMPALRNKLPRRVPAAPSLPNRG